MPESCAEASLFTSLSDTLRRLGALSNPYDGASQLALNSPSDMISKNKAPVQTDTVPQVQHFCALASKSVGRLV